MIQRLRLWLRSDMRVLRWVFLALYLLLISALSLPFLSDSDALALWLILAGIMVAGHGLFIFGSGTVRLCHPIRKHRLWMPVLAASFMLLVLSAALTLAIMELMEVGKQPNWDENLFIIVFWSVAPVVWFFWGVVLWFHVRNRPRLKVMSRLAGIVFVGSLAELLAAVPSHIVVSRRPGCLVGLWTMLGILAGIYVMLFTFGPAIVLLFLRPRYRREQMESATPHCPRCDYDLRGTLSAGRTSCPECGQALAGL